MIEDKEKQKRNKIIGIIVAIITILILFITIYCWQSIIVAQVVQTDTSQEIKTGDVNHNNNYDTITISYLDMLKYRFSDSSNNEIEVDGQTYELAPNTPIINHGLKVDDKYRLVSNKDLDYKKVTLSTDEGVTYISDVEDDYIVDNIVKSKQILEVTATIVDDNTLFIVADVTINEEEVGIGLYDVSDNTYVALSNEYIIESEDDVYVNGIKLTGANFDDIAADIVEETVVLQQELAPTNGEEVKYSGYNTYTDENNGSSGNGGTSTETDGTTNGGGTSNGNGGTTNGGGTSNGNGGETPVTLVKPVITSFTVKQIDETDTIELNWIIEENDYPINSIDIYVDGVKVGTIDGSSTTYSTNVSYDQHSVQIVANYDGGSVTSTELYVDVNGSITIDNVVIDSDTDSTSISNIEISGPVVDQIQTVTIELIGENGEVYTYELTADEVEALKTGSADVSIDFSGLDSNTKWTFNIYAYDKNGEQIPVNQQGANYIYTDAIAPILDSTKVEFDYYDKEATAKASMMFTNPDAVEITISDNHNSTITTADKSQYTSQFNVGTTVGNVNYEIVSATYIKNRGTNEVANVDVSTNNLDSFVVRQAAPFIEASQGLTITPGEIDAHMSLVYTDIDASTSQLTYTLYDENQQVVTGYENIDISTFAPDSTEFDLTNLVSGKDYYISINATYDDLDPTNGVNTTKLIDMQNFKTLDGTQLNYVSSAIIDPIETTEAQLNTVEFTGNAIPFIESAEVIATENGAVFNAITNTYPLTTAQINDIKDDNILTDFVMDGLTPATEYNVSFRFVTYEGVEIIIDAPSTGINFTTDNTQPVVVSHTITDGTTENGIYMENTPLTGTIVFDQPVESVVLSNGIVPTTTDNITWTYTTNAASPAIENTITVDSFTYIENPASPNVLTVDSTTNISDDTVYTTQKEVPTYSLVAWNNNIDDNFSTLSFTATVNDIDAASANLDLNLYNIDDPAYAAGELVDPLDSCPITTGSINCTTTVPLETGAQYEVRLEGTYDTYNPADVATDPLASLVLTVSSFTALNITSYDVTSTDTTINFNNIVYDIQDNSYITTLTAEIKDPANTVVETKTYTAADTDNTVISDINAGNPFAISVDGLTPNTAYTVNISTTFEDGKTLVATGMNPLNGYTNAITPTISNVVVTNGYVNDGQSGEFVVTFENPSNTRIESLSYTNTGGVSGTCDITAADIGDQAIATCPFTTNDVAMLNAEIDITEFTYYVNDGATTPTTVTGSATATYNVTKDMPTMVAADFINITSVETSNNNVDISVEFKYLDADTAASNIRVAAYLDANLDGIADSTTPVALTPAIAQNDTPQTVTLTGLEAGTSYVIDVVADIATYNPSENISDYVLASTTYTTPAGTFVEVTDGELVYTDATGNLLAPDTMILQNVTLSGSGVSSLTSVVGGTINVNGVTVALTPAMLTDLADGTQDTPITITGLTPDTLQAVTFNLPGYTILGTSVAIENYTNKEDLVLANISFDQVNNAYHKGSTGIATLNITDPNATTTTITSITSPEATFDPSTQDGTFTAPGTVGVAGNTGPQTINVSELCIDGNQDIGEQLSCQTASIVGTYTVIADNPIISVDVSNIDDTIATLTIGIQDIDSVVQNATITVTDQSGAYAQLATGEDLNNYPVSNGTVLNLAGLIPDEVYNYTVNYDTDLLDGNGLLPQTFTGSFSTTLSTIIDVTVTSGPTSVDVATTGHQYGATVTGTDNYDPTVTWSLAKNTDPNTVIDPTTGVLTIGDNETAAEISVIATSNMDITKYGIMTVQVNSVVETLDITSADTVVDAGGTTNPFVATVTGKGDFDDTVTWSVTGSSSVSGETVINATTGVLMVAEDEQSPQLTVTATSNQDPSLTDSVVIDVNSTTTGVLVTGSDSQQVGTSTDYNAVVTGTGIVTQDVTWSVAENTSASTTIDANGLLTVGTDEMADVITVVATSVDDNTVIGEKDVTIVPDVLAVNILTGPTDVVAGTNGNTYTAEVVGNGNIDQAVTWSVTGSQSPTGSTFITPSGELRVGPDETATQLTVVATSVEDPLVSDGVVVNVKPDIYSVVVTGPDSVDAGSTLTPYAAVVTGAGNYDPAVTWSIQGSNNANTFINPTTGELNIAVDEIAPTVNVVATSVEDPLVMASKTVTINSVVQDVIISGPTDVNAGTSNVPFTAQVTGLGNIDQTVTWTLSGNTSSSTTIDANGRLNVAQDEMAASLTLTATSVQDNTVVSQPYTVNILPVVTGVVVEGANGVFSETPETYTATVSGYGNISQAVTWTLTGQTAVGTGIDANGTVIVDPAETAPIVTVMATSVQDPTKKGTKVIGINTAIISVAIAGPDNVNVGTTGNSYTETVVGEGTYDDAVTWTVTGSQSATNGTTIDSNGVLTVAADEMATNLVVTATSVQDPAQFASMDIVVNTQVTDVVVTGPTPATIGGESYYTAEVSGYGNYSHDVTWSIIGANDPLTVIDPVSGLLYIAPNETSTSIAVRATSVQDPSEYGELVVTPGVKALNVVEDEIFIPFGDTGTTQQFTATLNDVPTTDVTWSITTASGEAVDEAIMSIDSATGILTIHDGQRAIGLDGPLKVTATLNGEPTVSDHAIINGEYVDDTGTAWVKYREDEDGNVLLTTKYLMGVSEFRPNMNSVEYHGSMLEENMKAYYNGTYDGNTNTTGIGADLKAISLPVNLHTDTEKATTGSGYMVDKGNGVMTEVDYAEGEYTTFPLSFSELYANCALSGYKVDTCKVEVWDEGAIGGTPGDPGYYWTTSETKYGPSPAAAVYVTSSGSAYYNAAQVTKFGMQPAIWVDPEHLVGLVINGPHEVDMDSITDYSAAIDGVELPDVTWTMTGNVSPNTTIDPVTGVLTVAADEYATYLTLTATDNTDPTNVEEYIVHINPTIESITITGPTDQGLGKDQHYGATVTGSGGNLSEEEIVWSITDQESPNTFITQEGELVTEADETAATITITATSTSNPDVSDTHTVTLTDSILSVVVSGPTGTTTGSSEQYAATVNGSGTYSSAVSWSVSGNLDPATTISSDGVLTISPNETSPKVTVRATSVQDVSVYDEHVVNITQPTLAITSNDPAVDFSETSTFQFTYDVVNGPNVTPNLVWTIYDADDVPVPTDIMSIDSNGLLTVHDGIRALGLEGPFTVKVEDQYVATMYDETTMTAGTYTDASGVSWLKWREDDAGNVLLVTEKVIGASEFSVNNSAGSHEYVGSELEAEMHAYYEGTYTGNTNVTGLGADLKSVAQPVNLHTDTEYANTGGSSYRVSTGNGVLTEVDPVNGEYTVFPLSLSEINTVCPTTGYEVDTCKVVNWDDGAIGGTPGVAAGYWTTSDATYSGPGIATVYNNSTVGHGMSNMTQVWGVRPALWIDPEGNEKLSVEGPTEVVMGDTADYTAMLEKTEVTDVTWSITGQQSDSTTIDPVTGLLTIGVDEMASQIKITATDSSNNTADFYVTVNPLVTGITITGPETIELAGEAPFTAVVEGSGANLATEELLWSVTSETSSATTIGSNGILYAGADEASREVTVTATSTSNPAISDATTIIVRIPTDKYTITGPDPVAEGTHTYSITAADGVTNYPVTWSIKGNTQPGTTIDPNTGVLTVDPNEAATKLTLTATTIGNDLEFATRQITVSPIVTGITVDGPTTVGVGESATYTYTITGTGPINRYVNWSVEGEDNPGTTISTNGVLTIAATETASQITVIATSKQDASKSASIDVDVTTNISDVVVNGAESVDAGTSSPYSATVNGVGDFDETVTWSIDGQNDAATTIDEAGLLTIAPTETSPLITVTATSNADPNISGTKDVTVNTVVNSITITGPDSVALGSENLYSATVDAAGNVTGDVTWSIQGASSAGTTIDPNTGVLTIDPSETSTSIVIMAVSVDDTSKYALKDVTITPVTTVTYDPFDQIISWFRSLV